MTFYYETGLRGYARVGRIQRDTVFDRQERRGHQGHLCPFHADTDRIAAATDNNPCAVTIVTAKHKFKRNAKLCPCRQRTTAYITLQKVRTQGQLVVTAHTYTYIEKKRYTVYIYIYICIYI
jgi:hypothetical protein